MAEGLDQTGGLFARPDVTSLGLETWAGMSGVHPDSPIVGGRNPYTGGVEAQFPYRRVAIGAPNSMPTHGSEVAHGHVSELLNFKHNPMPWLLVAAVVYLGLVHLHINGAVGAGVGRRGK